MSLNFMDTEDFDKLKDDMISKLVLFNYIEHKNFAEITVDDDHLSQLKALIFKAKKEGTLKELFTTIFIAVHTLGTLKPDFLSEAESVLLRRSLELFCKEKIRILISRNYEKKLSELHFAYNFVVDNSLVPLDDKLFVEAKKEINRLEQDILLKSEHNFEEHKNEFQSVMLELNSSVFRSGDASDNLVYKIRFEIQQAVKGIKDNLNYLEKIELQSETEKAASQLTIKRLEEVLDQVRQRNPFRLNSVLKKLQKDNRKFSRESSRALLLKGQLKSEKEKNEKLSSELEKAKTLVNSAKTKVLDEISEEVQEERLEYEREKERILKKWSEAERKVRELKFKLNTQTARNIELEVEINEMKKRNGIEEPGAKATSFSQERFNPDTTQSGVENQEASSKPKPIRRRSRSFKFVSKLIK
eukprot:snap_masked-scaffold_5-processed-gene-12.28-mRNA-1 protein AED:0.99 eAED:1.00 QI:0/-1/0/1/-1/1/1/0/414